MSYIRCDIHDKASIVVDASIDGIEGGVAEVAYAELVIDNPLGRPREQCVVEDA